jgi:hypothetical protein
MGQTSKGADDPCWGSLEDSSTFSLPDPSEFVDVEQDDGKLETSFKQQEPDGSSSSLPSFSKRTGDFFATEGNTNDKTSTMGKMSNHTTDATRMMKRSGHGTIGTTSNHTGDTTTSMGKNKSNDSISRSANKLNTTSTTASSTTMTSESANTSEEDSSTAPKLTSGGVSFGHLSWSESNSDLNNKSKSRISSFFHTSWSDSNTEGQKSKTGTTATTTTEMGSNSNRPQSWACFDDSTTNKFFDQSTNSSSKVEQNGYNDQSDRSCDSDDDEDYLGGYNNTKEHPIFMQGSKRVSSVPAPIQFEIPVAATATEPLVTHSLDMQ